MKRIKWIYGALFAVLTLLWLFAEQPWARHYDFFGLRKAMLNYTGIVAMGAMSVAMMLAIRPASVEPLLGGLDKSYRLHKWLGIAGLATGIAHWLWHDGAVWAVDLGWLARPERGPHPQMDNLVLQFFQQTRGFAEEAGTFAFYAAVVLIVLALVKRFPYRWFFRTHRVIAAVYLVLVFHSVVLIDFSYWQGPAAWAMLLLLAGGTVGALLSLTRRIGYQRRAPGRVEALDYHQDNHVLKVDIRLDKERWQGHDAGQFAFVAFNDDEGPHPFTISSAWSDDGSLHFHIKDLGDYTARLAATLKAGDPATVEGPYGCFRFESDKPRQIWVAGGIGITPFMAGLGHGRLAHFMEIGDAKLPKARLLPGLAFNEDATLSATGGNIDAAAKYYFDRELPGPYANYYAARALFEIDRADPASKILEMDAASKKPLDVEQLGLNRFLLENNIGLLKQSQRRFDESETVAKASAQTVPVRIAGEISAGQAGKERDISRETGSMREAAAPLEVFMQTVPVRATGEISAGQPDNEQGISEDARSAHEDAVPLPDSGLSVVHGESEAVQEEISVQTAPERVAAQGTSETAPEAAASRQAAANGTARHGQASAGQEPVSVESAYQATLAQYSQAKHAQAARLTDRLEQQIGHQTEKVQALQSSMPGRLSLPSTRRAWQEDNARAQGRLESLHDRLDTVRGIRTGVGILGSRLDEMAARKMRAENPELAANQDAVRLAARIQQHEQQMSRRQAQAQTHGRSRALA